MALTGAQLEKAAIDLGYEMFVEDNITANLTKTDLSAAVQSVDTAMAMVINDIPGPWGTKTIKQALIDNLPEPFQSNSTALQKALVLSYWALKESGQ